MKKFNPDAYWESRLGKKKGLKGVSFAKLGKAFNESPTTEIIILRKR